MLAPHISDLIAAPGKEKDRAVDQYVMARLPANEVLI